MADELAGMMAARQQQHPPHGATKSRGPASPASPSAGQVPGPSGSPTAGVRAQLGALLQRRHAQEQQASAARKADVAKGLFNEERRRAEALQAEVRPALLQPVCLTVLATGLHSLAAAAWQWTVHSWYALQHSRLTSAEPSLGHAALRRPSPSAGDHCISGRSAHLTLLCYIIVYDICCGVQVAHLQLMQQEAATAHMEQVAGLQQQVELEGRQRWEEAEARAVAQQRLKVGRTCASCCRHILLLEMAHRS